MKTRPNEIVHPQIETDPKREGDTWYGQVYSFGGITKREYFAALAMQGHLSNAKSMLGVAQMDVALDVAVATLAVESADALIDALNQEAKDATA